MPKARSWIVAAFTVNSVRAATRIVAALVGILGAYALVPLGTEEGQLAWLPVVIAGLALFVWVFMRQLSKIEKADFPVLRAVEALVLALALFLTLFAAVAVAVEIACGGKPIGRIRIGRFGYDVIDALKSCDLIGLELRRLHQLRVDPELLDAAAHPRIVRQLHDCCWNPTDLSSSTIAGRLGRPAPAAVDRKAHDQGDEVAGKRRTCHEREPQPAREERRGERAVEHRGQAHAANRQAAIDVQRYESGNTPRRCRPSAAASRHSTAPVTPSPTPTGFRRGPTAAAAMKRSARAARGTADRSSRGGR